ncbi:butyrophilin subfamily 2 member A1-like [Astatotilapia calliptera]|uniref:butyrophilin subfamily 2 member A1-like n=1 Tax=Astatotilapia calliptera TaxID=8154 RepID=UPI000E4023F5|nr:butyrophilin subfamily 2 member A1-like [Astatotilapia calliptera]
MESLGVVLLLTVIPGQTGQDEVQVEAGADATLDCQGPTEGTITVIAWNKRGMQTDGYVFFYREDRPYKAYQHPSFQGRVELGDPQMKGGNMSIILHNTTVNDTGTYECHISYQSGSGRDKRVTPEIISEISLKVVHAGQTGGHTEDGGDYHLQLSKAHKSCEYHVYSYYG